MISCRTFLFSLLIAAPCAAQFAHFECQPAGPLSPLAGLPDCEGATAEAGTGTAAIASALDCGFPTQGASYALLEGGVNVDRGFGAVVGRPLSAGVTELRIPVPAGSTFLSLDWAWNNEEGVSSPYNDGFDISLCDSAGARLLLVAYGDTALFAGGCTGVQSVGTPISSTPAGAYLSCAVFDDADSCCGANRLLVDAVAFALERVLFECATTGNFPAVGGPGNCENVTGAQGLGFVAAVTAGYGCNMPTQGAQYAYLSAGADSGVAQGGTIARPLGFGVAELRIPVPGGGTSIAFDWVFNQFEIVTDGFNDGYDIALCDSGGNVVTQGPKGDTSTTVQGCNGLQRFYAEVAPLAGGLYLSFVVFNGGDATIDSELSVDNVCFAPRPRLRLSSPSGAGSLRIDIDCGRANDVFFAPLTLAPGTFPEGWFYGLDIPFVDLLTQISLGQPFLGVLNGRGTYTFGPVAGLPPLSLYGVVLDRLGGVAPRIGEPAAHNIP
jgi:hypothetical protein